MKKYAEKVIEGITQFLETIMGLLVFFLIVVVFAQVLMRYVFNAPMAWSTELARFMLIWLTFCGASVATIRLSHLTMGLNLYSAIKNPVFVLVSKLVINIFVVIAMFVVGWYGTTTMLMTGARIAPMTGIPMYFVWAAMPFNFFIMVVFQVFNTIKEISSEMQGAK
jgi:TRAP-type transport system small permease protein